MSREMIRLGINSRHKGIIRERFFSQNFHTSHPSLEILEDSTHILSILDICWELDQNRWQEEEELTPLSSLWLQFVSSCLPCPQTGIGFQFSDLQNCIQIFWIMQLPRGSPVYPWEMGLFSHFLVTRQNTYTYTQVCTYAHSKSRACAHTHTLNFSEESERRAEFRNFRS